VLVSEVCRGWGGGVGGAFDWGRVVLFGEVGGCGLVWVLVGGGGVWVLWMRWVWLILGWGCAEWSWGAWVEGGACWFGVGWVSWGGVGFRGDRWLRVGCDYVIDGCECGIRGF